MCVFCGYECCVCKRCDVCHTVLPLCTCVHKGKAPEEYGLDFELGAACDLTDTDCESCQ